MPWPESQEMCRTGRNYDMWVHRESCADRNRYQFPVIITRPYHLARAFHLLFFTIVAEVLIRDPTPYSPPAHHRAKTFLVMPG